MIKEVLEFFNPIRPVSTVKVSITKEDAEDFKLIGNPSDVNGACSSSGLGANP